MQEENKIKGQEVTPYELKRVNELTAGKSLRANLALLLNNAKLAAHISRALVSYEYQQKVV
jgi:pseudouridine-5'-phosphate glycosidase